MGAEGIKREGYCSQEKKGRDKGIKSNGVRHKQDEADKRYRNPNGDSLNGGSCSSWPRSSMGLSVRPHSMTTPTVRVENGRRGSDPVRGTEKRGE